MLSRGLPFLNSYSWPGNIRELQAAIFRLIVLHHANVVNVDVLQSLCHLSAVDSGHQDTSTPLTGEVDLLKKQEQKLIASVMKQTGGDRGRAAVILGISPTTLWRKIKAYEGEGG